MYNFVNIVAVGGIVMIYLTNFPNHFRLSQKMIADQISITLSYYQTIEHGRGRPASRFFNKVIKESLLSDQTSLSQKAGK